MSSIFLGANFPAEWPKKKKAGESNNGIFEIKKNHHILTKKLRSHQI
jgi:hypothetical protein